MRPRRCRDAAALWHELERVRGVAGRDAVWAHPDLLPGPADLDDPSTFVSGSSISDDELAAIASGEFPTQAAPDDGEQAGPDDVSDADAATAGEAVDEDASDADEPGDADESGKPDTAG